MGVVRGGTKYGELDGLESSLYHIVLFTWLFILRKNEEEAKKRLLDNPIKLQQLQQVNMCGCGLLWLS